VLSLLRLISWRHLIDHPLRSVLTVIGVTVGVATMIGVSSINRTVMGAFRSTIDLIAGKTDLVVAGASTGFEDTFVDEVRKVPGVGHANGGFTTIAPVQGSPGESLFVMGVDFLDDGFFRSYEGKDTDVAALSDNLEFLNSADRMLVSERFAAAHNYKTGDTFTLLTKDGPKDFIIHGQVKETGPIKAFGGWVGIMYVASAQAAFNRGTRIDRIDVAVAPGSNLEEVKATLEKQLGPAFTVDKPERRGESTEKMVRSFQMGLNLSSAVALLVGVFLVYNTVSVGVLQRRREIGTLRAIGATRLRIRTLFTLEALIYGVFGSAFGIPLGVVIARAAVSVVSNSVSTIYVQINAKDVVMGPQEITVGIILGLLGTAFAALRPATVASSVAPVEALRRDIAAGAGAASLHAWPTYVGGFLWLAAYPSTLIPAPIENFPIGGYLTIFCTIMGTTLLSPLILRGLQRVYQAPGEALAGIAGRLAADNFARAPVRTAVPVAALMVGVAMSVGMSGFIGSFQASSEKWIDQSVPADLFVTSADKLAGVKNNPMSPALGFELEKIEGVANLDRVRLMQHDVLGLRVFVISLIPEIYNLRGRPEVLAGKLPTPEDRAQGKVTISENLARRRDLKPGSTFVMNTPSGAKTLTVAAVIIDYTSDQGTVLLDRRYYSEWFKDDMVDTFQIYLKDMKDLDRVRREVTEKWGKKYDLYVLSNKELRDEAYTLVDGAFSVTYAMEAVAVLLALLGVVNTLLAAVLDRTREIGLLRAIGAGRQHVMKLITTEALFIGFTGGAIGVGVGIVLGLVISKVVGVQSTGWDFPYLFPWKLALSLVGVASICALVAGLYPARRAARLDVVEALSYE
jgi:putative ABC transport system permease protein